MKSKSRLFVRGSYSVGPLHLLRRNENGLSFALGYAIQQSSKLRALLFQRLGFVHNGLTPIDVALQEKDDLGITDIELRDPGNKFLIVLEAKIGGWPGLKQLGRYAEYMKAVCQGRKLLVALGLPPFAPALWRTSAIGGIDIVRLRWADVLTLVHSALMSARNDGLQLLAELAELIHEVTGMRSYDREVLVRDLDVESISYRLFIDDNVYACQPNERAEPLFFAPCFTKAISRTENGIHYVSRVYHRAVISFADKGEVQQALANAEQLIDDQASMMSRRKGAAEDVVYLRTLPGKWRRGVAQQAARRRRETNAVFFLGDPARLPVPLMKKGFMVPIGFSITWERLMSAKPGSFRC